ncbi:MAG TPA: glycosyltransferase [Polyangia bacterium]|nr:glycosyltransferase [Polyangia bacterium]
MVIAHLLSSYFVGGQERVALDLATRQSARGHRVMAVSLAPPPEGPLAEELRRAGIAAHTVPKLGPSLDPTLPMRLGALLRREGVEVVHAHNPQPLIYGSIAAKLVGATMIQTRHGVAFHSERQDWLVRQATKLVDASVFVSRELATKLGGAGQEPGKTWVIENGVDLGRFFPDAATRAAVRAELGIPADAQVIGTVSRLVRTKNVPGLLRAAWPLLGEKVHLVVVGDGPDRQDVEQLVVFTPKAASVHVLGARNDVGRLLRAFDLFVLFSRTEGHPIVVLEAMATALPVVATPVGGIPGIIDDEETGFLVPTDDEEALRGLLTQLLASPQRLAEVGWRARAVALERYAAERMVDEYLALYARWGKEWSEWSAPH